MERKSILIKDTTREEREQIIKTGIIILRENHWER